MSNNNSNNNISVLPYSHGFGDADTGNRNFWV